MHMQNETQQDPYTNYDKDFVHTKEQLSQIDIIPNPSTVVERKATYMKNNEYSILKTLSLVIICCICILVTASYYTYRIFTAKVTPIQTPIVIDIPKGTSLQKTTELLSDAGVISSAFMFRSSMIIAGFDSAIKTGEYTFSKPANMVDIIQRLVKGSYEYIPVKLIIKEGENSEEIATDIFNQFPKLASSTTLVDALKMREGKLFPETYNFAPFATEDQILHTIDSEYQKRIVIYKDAIASSTHTELEILTIASILEREVPKKEDMHIVSGIIYNRLAKGMPLQMDSTLGYITQKASLQLTTEDLQLDSPYNTYKNKGLPPGPIGNPGDASIYAALHPDTHTYIFFLSDANGVNHYATTYGEHLKNRNKYLGK